MLFWSIWKKRSKAKLPKNEQFLGKKKKKSSSQQTKSLISMLMALAREKWREHCHVFNWPYAIDFLPTNMVRTSVRGNLRMRKQNTKTTVPLDMVPERRTKRFPPRFRPVGHFCELRCRYLPSQPGREGGRERERGRGREGEREISRPLDHLRQIPLIHSARIIDSANFYIHRIVF